MTNLIRPFGRDALLRVRAAVVLFVILALFAKQVHAAANSYPTRIISGGQTSIVQTIEFDSGTMSSSSYADGTPKTILHGLGGPGGTVLKVITAADSQTNNVNTLIFNTGTQSPSGSSSTLFGLGSGGGSPTNIIVTNVTGTAVGFVFGQGSNTYLTTGTHVGFPAVFDAPPVFNTPVTFNSTVTNNEYIDNITTIATGTNFVYYGSIVTQQLVIYQNVYVSTNILYGFGKWTGYNAGFIWTNLGDYALIPGLAAVEETGTNAATGVWDFTGATLIGVAATGDLAGLSNTLLAVQLASNAVLQSAINGMPTFTALNGASNTLVAAQNTLSNYFSSGFVSVTNPVFAQTLTNLQWSGYQTLVRPSDIFGWTIGSGSTFSNNIVPVYWSTTVAGGDTLALGFTSSDTGTLNTRYAYAILPIPSLAQGWAAGTGMVIRVITSSSSSLTNTLNVRITSPTGSQFTTNNLTSTTSSNAADYFILSSSLPTFANTTTNDWTVRFDFQARNSATQGVVAIKGRFQ